MREYSIPALADIPATANLADLVRRRAAEQPEAVALRRKNGAGTWADVSTSQFRDEVYALAGGLIAAGIEAGDRVAIMACTSYEWTLIDYALWTAGAIPVPIYETSSAEQAEWILSDSAAKAVFVESEAFEQMVAAAHDRLPALEHVWRFDPALKNLAADGAERSRADDHRAGQLGERGRPRHPHLHVGNHGQAQGLRAHPREPPVGRAERVHGAARRVQLRPGRVHAAVPAAGAYLRPHHRGRDARGRDHPRPLLGHERPAAGPGVLPAVVHPRGAARLREGLQRGRAEGDRRRQGGDLRPGGPGSRRLQPGAGHPGRPGARAKAAARGLRPARLRQAAGRAWRQGPLGDLRRRGAERPARALLPWRRASPSWKATASPRRPPPRPSTGPTGRRSAPSASRSPA